MWTKENGLWILGFLGFLVVDNIADRLLDRAIDWILPETPNIMFTAYNIAMIFVATIIAIAIVYILLNALKSGWKLLTDRTQQQNVFDVVRQWPTGKRDVFTAMAITWNIAIFVPLFVLISTVPEGQLAGRIPIETLLIIMILAIVPMYPLFLWYGYDFLRQLKQQWRTETRNGRIVIATIAIVSIIIFALFVWGDISGWDDRAWFATGQR